MLKLTRALKYLSKSRITQPISWKKDPFIGIQQSSYYRPRVSVQSFLRQNGIQFNANNSVFRIKECIFCPKPHYNDITNLYTLNISKEQGMYYCHRCQAKGKWMDFKSRFLGLHDSDRVSLYMNEELCDNSTNSDSPQRGDISDVEYYIYEKQLKSPDYQEVLGYLKTRGFTEQTIQLYRVGAGVERFNDQNGNSISVKVIYFPMTLPKRKKKNPGQISPNLDYKKQEENNNKIECAIKKMKIRGGSSTTKRFMRQAPSGHQSGFFGMHTINENDKMVVLTQGEFDAMAVYQQTGYPAISLPQGANSLPDTLLPYLDRFQSIVLWVDKDQAGRLAQEKIGFKLGEKRTRIVSHNEKGLKDANDFLKSRPDMMKSLIQNSKTKSEQNILKFPDLLEGVKKRITHSQEYMGTEINWLPFFNKKVKGIRMEQVSIVSGQTGCGKTTFLSQISLDLAKKGIPVLWGSFQVKNQVLVTNMLLQFSGVNLLRKSNLHLFDSYAANFSNLPFSWLSFHGSHDYLKVLSTIEYAIEKSNISVVILDTLQFFLSGQAVGEKKFDLQDIVMDKLRKIATNYKVHIVVVIHPRKTEDQEDIQIHSIYGSGKSTQEADNVWVIQKRQHFRIFDVKKNRYDGEIGKCAIGFDKETKSFFQLVMKQLKDLKDGNKTFAEILEDRKRKQKGGNNEEYDFQMEKHFSIEDNATQSQTELLKNEKTNKNFRKY